MPLPDLIEIVPLEKLVRAEITVPGSKSITNRALILAALADGEVTLEGALWSEDTQVMTEALTQLGFAIKVEADPHEFCNRRITVRGLSGKLPNAGTAEKPLELFVGNAGTAARFLAAMVCLGDGAYRLSGVPRMHERPQAELFNALRELGYRVDSANDRLPAIIHGLGRSRVNGTQTNPNRQKLLTSSPTGGGERSCTVSMNESSQFASALLLCARHGRWQVEVTGDHHDEAPYVTMTQKLIQRFPQHGGRFEVEPDASSGSYFWAAGHLLLTRDQSALGAWSGKWSVSVINWPKSDWQIDSNFADRFTKISDRSPNFERAGKIDEEEEFLRFQNSSKSLQFLSEVVHLSRAEDLGDSIMTAIAVSPLAVRHVQFTDLGRLRLQETERVVALRTELSKCGVKVIEEGDTLTVYPSQLHGAEIETYNDHRMAMCFAILGLKVPGIKLKNPACVKKTFPNFFQKLAAPPPGGLGAEIRDGRTGRKLRMEELFAE